MASTKLNPEKWQSQKKKSKYLKISSLFACFIAVIPFLFYVNDIFPNGSIWENTFFTYHSQYYKSIDVFIWILLGKFIPLSLFFVWFLTCKHWWYPVILIPITLYIFQLTSIIIEDSASLVESQKIYFLIPIVIIILSVLYTIRVKVFDKIHDIDLSELMISNKKSWWNRFR
ncbi:hypothetical protein [Aquimarina addita]|uniref:hypothetical protein n=1 Tax=Aquimarina addita TaxID=870485 RepID=UPI0031EF47F6